MSLAQGNYTPTRPRIEPGSPDPESDALTTRPVRSPLGYVIYHSCMNLPTCMMNEKIQKRRLRLNGIFLISQRFILTSSRYSIFDRCNDKVTRYNTILLHRYLCVYSCLKLSSNRPEAVLNPCSCSNHEIRVPFEHGFQLHISERTLFQRRYLALRRCPFQTFVTKC